MRKRLVARGATLAEEFVETWITLPRHYRPREWDDQYNEPVVRLDLNLYGHPLVGLYWEIHTSDVLIDNGFEKVPGWECL